MKEIEAAVNAEVEDAVKFADESPKPVSQWSGSAQPATSVHDVAY